MSSGFAELSRTSSRLSVYSETSDTSSYYNYHKPGALTFSSNIGLARVLNERHIHGHLSSSTMSLANEDHFKTTSLTPSIISSPCGSKSFSPTGTPLNSPLHTPPGTPPNEPDSSSGIVQGFFASLKSALYGEQQKEAQTLRRKKKRKKPVKKFGILEKVEEVGVENLMNPDSQGSLSRESSSERSFSDELEDIEPGSLTLTSKSSSTVGQLSAPSFYTRPRLDLNELGHVPDRHQQLGSNLGGGAIVGGRGPGRVMCSPGEKRPVLIGALGVPGTPGTGALKRQDLGSVPMMSKSPNKDESSSGFIGTITTMFFGRKGGLF